MIKDKFTLSEAIKIFGVDNRKDHLAEECGEYIVALNHMKRNRINHGALLEEMVDIEIMIDQMKLLYYGEEWLEIRKLKISRLNDEIKRRHENGK